MTARGSSWLLLSLFLAANSTAPAQAVTSDSIGKKIDALSLKDAQGGLHSLDDWKDRKAIVVIFLGTDCPLAKLYGPKLAAMAERYKDKMVQFVAVDSNQQDTLAAIAHYVRLHKITFPVLKDPGNVVADLFAAVRTPEVFVLDENRTVRYRGRIDDQFGVGYAKSSAKQHTLEDALEDVLAGRAVRVAATEAVGCRIGRLNRNSPKGDVTYSNQISRILQAHCVSCHRPGEIAPFPMTSYKEVVGWAETMRDAIDDQRMPPWHANPHYGKFTNDARLSSDEKRLVSEWIENGLPEGDPSQLPAPRTFTEGWQIPTPDLIVTMPKPFTVPAQGVVEYQVFIIDRQFDHDVWIRAAEGRPSNRSVVHHMVLFYMPAGQDKPQPQDALFNTVASAGPGVPALIAPEGCAWRIPAGSKLVFQMHYTPNGSEQTDQSTAGFVFADPKTVKRELKIGAVTSWEFAIPPGAADHVVKAHDQFDEDSVVYAFVPHMHLRGKAYRFTAVYPDKRNEILLDVPKYDFNWQNIYHLTEPRVMPKGSSLEGIAHFDNSEHNLSNPDPTQTATFGEQTWNEMMVGLYYYSLADQDLTLGPPRVKKVSEGRYEAAFRYRPTVPAKAVYLAGTFNKWKPTELKMAGPDKEGWYTTSLPLREGRYEYKFVIDGKSWKQDPGNANQTGEYHNSVLTVGSAGSTRVTVR